MKYITVASYNIRHGADVDGDWNRLAAVIKESGADVVGLQEVDMHTSRVGGRDTLEGLKTATGFEYALFIPAMEFAGGLYGTAILSRLPLECRVIQALDSGAYEPRAFGCVTVSLGDGKDLWMLNTHLSYESDEQRRLQMAQLADFMGRAIPSDAAVVLTGDFNTENFSSFAPILAQGYALINDDVHRLETFRDDPIAIDNIVYRQARIVPIAFAMIDSPCSDHNLLWCRFELA